MDIFSLVLDMESFYENLQFVSLKAAHASFDVTIVKKLSSRLSLRGLVGVSKILSHIFVEELQGIRKTCFITQNMRIHIIALGKWSPSAEVKGIDTRLLHRARLGEQQAGQY